MTIEPKRNRVIKMHMGELQKLCCSLIFSDIAHIEETRNIYKVDSVTLKDEVGELY